MSSLKKRVRELQALSGLKSYQHALQIYRAVGDELARPYGESPKPKDFMETLHVMALQRMKAAADRKTKAA